MTRTDRAADIPPFYCPIEPEIHPQVDEVEKRAVTWLDHAGFIEDDVQRSWVIATNGAEFYARITPTGDPHRLETAIQWVYWGFAFDDARCDAGPLSADPARFVALASRLLRTAETPELTETAGKDSPDPYAEALSEIARAFRLDATPVQMRRWIEALRSWLFGVAWQIGNHSRKEMPNLNDYITMRLGSAGGLPVVSMIEVVNGGEIPGYEMDSPAVRALTELASLIAAWDNDLVSRRKEAAAGQTDQDIINVLAAEHNWSQERALVAAVAMRDRMMTLFLRLREQVASKASRELTRYLTDLGNVIRGNIEWSLRVPRFNSLSDPSAAPGSPTVLTPGWAPEPSDRSLEPLPSPTIAWWWSQLDR